MMAERLLLGGNGPQELVYLDDELDSEIVLLAPLACFFFGFKIQGNDPESILNFTWHIRDVDRIVIEVILEFGLNLADPV
jgi:hypothetical protein